MTKRCLQKLKNLTIVKRELHGLLKKLGFQKTSGKGSHEKWTRHANDPVIVLATHTKELPRYQIKQVLRALQDMKLLGNENEDR